MTSKTPIQGDLESLVSFMKTDKKLMFLTQSYRQTGKKTFKADAPLFAPACYLEGGKGQDNIRELTHLSLVDFDELFPEVPPDITALNALKQKLCDDPHTMLCYITMSGNGIRVIYPYEGDDYPAAFAKGNDYYQQLIGKEADFQCKNVNRLSGLAYDPDAYYKSCAKPFTAEEISKFHTEATKKNQQLKKQDRINTYYEQIIKPKLAADNIIYEPHNHNNRQFRAELRGMPEKVARGNDCRLAGRRGGQQCHPGLYRKTGCQQDHLVQPSPSAGAEAVLLHEDQCQANDEG